MSLKLLTLASLSISGVQVYNICNVGKGNKNLSYAPLLLEEEIRLQAKSLGVQNPQNLQVYISRGIGAFAGGSPTLGSLFSCRYFIALPFTSGHSFIHHPHMYSAFVEGRHVDWESEEGLKILEYLTPTKEHLKFTIGHELAHLKFDDALLSCFVAPASAFISLFLGGFIAQKLENKFFSGKRSLFGIRRIGIWSFSAIFVISSYLKLSSIFSRAVELRADTFASMIDDSVAQGGLEFLEKRKKLHELLLKDETFDRKCIRVVKEQFSTHPSIDSRISNINKILKLKNQS